MSGIESQPPHSKIPKQGEHSNSQRREKKQIAKERGKAYANEILRGLPQIEAENTTHTFHDPDAPFEKLPGGRRYNGSKLGLRQDAAYHGWDPDTY